ncbi:uncharacterized protein BX663DRAFT_486400 [Cokeromyces recurvatus]|uniref:uncharacterized protein n=1 Tax=Cokeromyces recurvatus TaxID=90255 RepID=UPI0022206F28|nr:uncharacterized protein BX663DRAFT_486400 [Cokeromyces recurvatus]KAI7902587.1 hypothetical protein BX663DRAFT_486400 [Cokeromyces recurvatus]
MFSRVNPFDESVTAATNENLTVENWELILAVTDKLNRATPDSARDCIAAVEKRLNNRNPNVQLYAIALAEALVKNCDITVHREISSRSFTNTLTKLVHDKTVHPKVKTRILEFIQMCSFEFRADSTLGLINEVYHSLRAEGIQFPSPQKPRKEFTQSELDKQKEEEELQLALALSLSESENRHTYKSHSFFPCHKSSTATTSNSNPTVTATKPKSADDETAQISRVRALYDFQPTEQGELGFQKGDIIRVIESVYRDWWKGELRGKTGIFPVNYVEKIVDPSPSDLLKEVSIENEVLNETRNIDRLLEILSSDTSSTSFSDNEELQSLYNSTLAIRPKLVKLIEKYSLKRDELVALNEKFMRARTMYDSMLSNSIAKYSTANTYGYPPAVNQQSPYYTEQSTYSNNYGYQQSPVQVNTQSTSIYGSNDAMTAPGASTVTTTNPQQQPYDYQQQYHQTSFDNTTTTATTATNNIAAPTVMSPPPPPQQHQTYTNYAPPQQSITTSDNNYYPPVNYNSTSLAHQQQSQTAYTSSVSPSQTISGYPQQQQNYSTQNY